MRMRCREIIVRVRFYDHHLTDEGFERLLDAIEDASLEDTLHDCTSDAINAQLPQDFPDDTFSVDVES